MKRPNRATLLVCFIGSVCCDLDLIYFYTIDQRQHLHHSYWSHIPFWWLLISLVTVILPTRHRLLGILFFGNVLLHLVLDTMVGGIQWAYPLSNRYFFWLEIQPVYDWWVLNFVLHPTFFAEILLVAVALIVWRKARPSG